MELAHGEAAGDGGPLDGASMEGGERSLPRRITETLLLHVKIRDRLGVHRRDEGEVGGRLAEVGVEATKEVGEEDGVIDVHADVAQLVGENLQPRAILIDRKIVLLHSEEFTLEEDTALELIVEEEVAQPCPHSVRRRITGVHHVEETWRDGEKKPLDDASIHSKPLVVVLHVADVDAAINMLDEAEGAEEEREVGAPCVVGRKVEVEDDGNVVFDVELVEAIRGEGGTGERTGVRGFGFARHGG